MLTIILSILIIVCAYKWWSRYLAAATLFSIWKSRGYDPPTDEEVRTHTTRIIYKMFGVKRKTVF